MVLYRQLSGSKFAGEISRNTLVFRFIYDKKKIRRSDHSVKAQAFLPDRAGETSVFTLEGMTDSEILRHEEKHGQAKRSLKAFAKTTTDFVRSVKLHTIACSPPPCHAAIRGWPDSAELRLQAAQLIASDASKRGIWEKSPTND